MSCQIVDSPNISLIKCHDLLDKLKRIEHPVGEGQYGKVYIIDDLNYAIKVIPKSLGNYESRGESSVDSSYEESYGDYNDSSQGDDH